MNKMREILITKGEKQYRKSTAENLCRQLSDENSNLGSRGLLWKYMSRFVNFSPLFTAVIVFDIGRNFNIRWVAMGVGALVLLAAWKSPIGFQLSGSSFLLVYEILGGFLPLFGGTFRLYIQIGNVDICSGSLVLQLQIEKSEEEQKSDMVLWFFLYLFCVIFVQLSSAMVCIVDVPAYDFFSICF